MQQNEERDKIKKHYKKKIKLLTRKTYIHMQKKDKITHTNIYTHTHSLTQSFTQKERQRELNKKEERVKNKKKHTH